MRQYLDLLRFILEHGVRKPTRTKSKKTGTPLDAISVFGYQVPLRPDRWIPCGHDETPGLQDYRP